MRLLQSIRVTAAGSLLAWTLACAAAPAPGPGDVPPPALGYTFGGDEVLLPHYAGKAVIVTFWATWCAYCLKELPILDNVQARVGKDQMAVIAVNTEKRDVFRRAAHYLRDSIHFELVSDASGLAQQAYGVNGIPHMVIIGRDGRILKVYRGYSESSLDAIVADINKALAPLP